LGLHPSKVHSLSQRGHDDVAQEKHMFLFDVELFDRRLDLATKASNGLAHAGHDVNTMRSPVAESMMTGLAPGRHVKAVFQSNRSSRPKNGILLQNSQGSLDPLCGSSIPEQGTWNAMCTIGIYVARHSNFRYDAFRDCMVNMILGERDDVTLWVIKEEIVVDSQPKNVLHSVTKSGAHLCCYQDKDLKQHFFLPNSLITPYPHNRILMHKTSKLAFSGTGSNLMRLVFSRVEKEFMIYGFEVGINVGLLMLDLCRVNHLANKAVKWCALIMHSTCEVIHQHSSSPMYPKKQARMTQVSQSLLKHRDEMKLIPPQTVVEGAQCCAEEHAKLLLGLST
jgi:hypothetical protein